MKLTLGSKIVSETEPVRITNPTRPPSDSRCWRVVAVVVFAGVAACGIAKASAAAVPPKQVTSSPTVAVGTAPDGLVFNAGTDTLYTSNQTSNSVSVVNTDACKDTVTSSCAHTVSSIPLGAKASPEGVAFDADTDTLYVADNGGGISVVDGATCNAHEQSECAAPVAQMADDAGPLALAVNPLTDTVYVANFGKDLVGIGTTVSVLNGATCNARRTSGCDQTPATIGVGQGPAGVAVNPSSDTVYVPNGGVTGNGDTVSVIDGTTCNGTHTSGCGNTPESITVGHSPNWIALDPQNGTAYTPNQADNDVSVIDIATCNATVVSGCSQKAAEVPVGDFPWALTVDQALHTVFVANNKDETLSVINTDTCNGTVHSSCSVRPPTTQIGGGPQAVALDPSTNTIYTANFTDNTVSVVNTGTCNAEVTTGCRPPAPTAPVGSGPTFLAVDEAVHTLYVANQGSNTVSVINTTGCSSSATHGCRHGEATVHVGTGPTGVAIDPGTHSLYVADSGGSTVSVIDTTTCNAEVQSGCGQAPAEVTVGSNPFGIALDPVTDTVYVTNLGPKDEGDTVSVIDAATCNADDRSGCGQTPAEVTVGSGPFGIAVNPTTDTVYVANSGQLFTAADGHTLSVINGITCNAVQSSGCGQTPTTVTVGRAPFGVATDDATNTVYVVNNQGGETNATLSTIDGAHCDATNRSDCIAMPPTDLGPGRAPNGVVLDPSTHTLYTANFINATVSAIDLNGPTAERTSPRFAVGSAPQGIAIDPANHTVYVANSLDGNVSVLPVIAVSRS
jgi:YVTN family beta-propeller protein